MLLPVGQHHPLDIVRRRVLPGLLFAHQGVFRRGLGLKQGDGRPITIREQVIRKTGPPRPRRVYLNLKAPAGPTQQPVNNFPGLLFRRHLRLSCKSMPNRYPAGITSNLAVVNATPDADATSFAVPLGS